MNGLSLKDVSKRFGSFTALDQISVHIRHGELCGLAGHNGAGKSTLINILSGALPSDTGSIELNGEQFRARSYRDAMRAGIFRVSQELTLFDNLTVMDNAAFGLEDIYTRQGFLNERLIRQELTAFLDSLGLSVLPLTERVGALPLALKQLTEITRCLFSAFKRGIAQPVLLFDEPTSGLSHSQAEFVAQQLRILAARAIIILTSHRGRELLDLSQRVIVLRAGRLVADQFAQALDPVKLEELMTGTTRQHAGPSARPKAGDSPVVLEIASPRRGETITVRRGEILGLAGEDEDKSLLLAAVAGWRYEKDLQVRVDGHQLSGDVAARARRGMRYVPGERAREGFSVWQPITWNVTMPHIVRGGKSLRYPRRPREERRFVTELVDRFGVRVPDVAGSIASLSGGNQQRLLVARMLDPDARILLCDRPTRGVDVTATAEVHAAIKRAAEAGIACLIASDEPEELEALCDRVFTLSDREADRQILAALHSTS